MPDDRENQRDGYDELAAAAKLVLEAAQAEPIPDPIIKLAEQLETMLEDARKKTANRG